jgi:[ribosomal protein S5]-alanine N-acetyltransferase
MEVSRAPERIETERLVLRRPVAADAEPIFRRYASVAEVTRYLSFPRHVSIDQTRAFLAFSDAEWQLWPAGPYLVESREDGTLLGGTGLAFENPQRATTGYVLARDAWGHGYATEALRAVVGTAGSLGVRRLQALCHPDHRPSWRVLEKCGFTREGTLLLYAELPNLSPGEPVDLLSYARIFP